MTKSKKTIGILAGMGPRSTAPFLNMVLDECQKQYGAKYDDEFPRIMIYSLPTPFYIDKPVDATKLKEVVCEGLKRLESTGVDFIVVPCGSVHTFFDDMAASVSVPVLHMIEESIVHISSDVTSIGLVATKMTADGKLYQDALKKKGIQTIESGDLQAQVDRLILGVKTGWSKAQLDEEFKTFINLLHERGAGAVLVACTDLSELAKSPQTLPVFDAVAGLARSTVERYLRLS